jgi:adenosylcobinamide-GDP ribazoletransferase
MKDNGESGQHGREGGTAPAEFLSEFRLALSFLTILPVIDERPSSDEAVAASFAWFPLIGFAIGASLCAEDTLLAFLFGQTLRSVLIILSLTVLTGAVHLDGLADMADAFGAGRNRDRALEIMRDSRVGTFGAAAIFFDLALKVLALATIAGTHRRIALLIAIGFSRWAMTAVAKSLDYLRSDGAGSALLKSQSRWGTPSDWIYGFGGLFLGIYLGVLREVLITIVIVIAAAWFYRRWLGGLTGDLIGACGEIVEIAILIAMAR